MLKPLLTLATFLFYLVASGQAILRTHKETNSLEVEFAALDYLKPLPFNAIEVVDCRFDTSKMGYSGKKKYYKVVTKEAFSKTIESLLNHSLQKNFTASSGRTLLVMVKKFWFRETTAAEQKGRFITGGARPGEAYTACFFKFEMYIRQADGYTPIVRMDSVCSRPTVHQGESFSLDAFEACLQRLERIDLERSLQVTGKLGREDINNYNRQAVSRPVFNNPVVKAGVYITFNDFLQNQVSYPEFDLELSALTDQLYVLENGEKRLLTEFWGYCDGAKYFIKSGFNFFELQKAGNAFEFWGSQALVDDHLKNNSGRPPRYNSAQSLASDMAANGLLNLLDAGNIKSEGRPFQVNMETGKVY